MTDHVTVGGVPLHTSSGTPLAVSPAPAPCFTGFDDPDGSLGEPWQNLALGGSPDELDYWSFAGGVLVGDGTPQIIACATYGTEACCGSTPATIDFRYLSGRIGVAPVWENSTEHTVASVGILHMPEGTGPERWRVNYHGIIVLAELTERPEHVKATWFGVRSIRVIVDGHEVYAGEPLIDPGPDVSEGNDGGEWLFGSWKFAVITGDLATMFDYPPDDEVPALRDLTVRCA